jgi:hypothetical protein
MRELSTDSATVPWLFKERNTKRQNTKKGQKGAKNKSGSLLDEGNFREQGEAMPSKRQDKIRHFKAKENADNKTQTQT